MAVLTARERKMKRKLRRLEHGLAEAVRHHEPTARWTPQGRVVWIPVLIDPHLPAGRFRAIDRPPIAR